MTSLTQGTSDAVVSSVGDYVAVRLGKRTWYMAIITEDDNETKEVKSSSWKNQGHSLHSVMKNGYQCQP